MNTEAPQQITVICDNCEQRHEGDYAGNSAYIENMPIYEITCTVDWLSDWYTLEASVER